MEEIIIDGIDVSGCKHYKNRTCLHDYLTTDEPFDEALCVKNINCYYKQLKRKEKECEELKRGKTKYQNRYQQLAGSYNKAESYKQALQEIKEIVNQQRADIRVLYDRNTEIRMKFILQKISEVDLK